MHYALTKLRHSLLLQALVAGVGLGLIAALVYGSYIAEGGFVTDPWVVQGWYEFAPEHGLFELSKLYIDYNGIGIVRSLDFIRLAVQSEVLGFNMTAWLAWQVVMCVIMSTSLFLLLRELRIPAVHAAAIAALILIFPAATSIRIWPIMGSPAAVTLVALGFVLALRAFESRGPRQLALHAVSLLFYVASAFLYEAAVPLMYFSILLYRVRVPWRQAAQRWAVDLAALCVVSLILHSEASARGEQDLAGMIDHAGTMANQALSLFTSVVLPLGDVNHWLTLIATALIPIAAVLMLRRNPRAPQADGLRAWLWVLAAGILVVVLGYAAYVPGDDYYEPLGPGIGNRVNAVPGVGFVLVLYALAMLLATLALSRSWCPRRLVPLAALAACAAVAVCWLQSIDRDEDAFLLAHDEGERVMREVRSAVPAPLAQSVIWTFGQPMEVVPGVPIFDQWGNMSSRVRLAYDDPTLHSLIAAPGVWFDCTPTAIVPHGSYYDTATTEATQANVSYYGRTYFVDTTLGRGELIRTPRECRRAAAFPGSPYLPGERAPAVRVSAPPATDVDPEPARSHPLVPGAVSGYVDYATVEGDVVYLSGWAVTGDQTRPADRAIGIVGGKEVAGAEITGDRPDVVRALSEPSLAKSGFVLAVQRSALKCGARAAGLEVLGALERSATPLPFVGNSSERLEEAC
jgi:hypothetical protein